METDRYRALARVYDAVMEDVEYDEWFDFLLSHVRRGGLPSGPLLDLGCGTGNATGPAVRGGWDVDGLDASASMLDEARSKFPTVTFHQGDVRSFTLPRRYAVAYSLFDVVNHLLDDGDVASMARTVLDHLVPGGWFVFDANTRAGLRHLWTDGRAEGWTGDVYYRWEHRFDEASDRAHVDAYCHDAMGDFVEHHVERPYEPHELETILRDVGFVDVWCTTFPGGSPPSSDEPRVWMFSRRPVQI